MGQRGSSRSLRGQPDSCVCYQAQIMQGRAPLEDPMTQPLIFIGIGVSKAQLDVAQRPTGRFVVSNDDVGIAQRLKRLRSTSTTLIILEATGGIELPLTGALAAAGLPVIVRQSAPSQGLRESHRAVGEDECARCAGVGPLCRRGAAVAPLAAVYSHARTGGLGDGARPTH